MGLILPDSIYLPSNHWVEIGRLNDRWIEEHGVRNFKRTLSQNYYNWLITSWRDPKFLAVLLRWLFWPSLAPLDASMGATEILRTPDGLEELFGPREQRIYKNFVAMLWDIAVREDHVGLGHLEEPSLGNPLKVFCYGRRISQDLANSIIERNTVERLLGREDEEFIRIGELGAGYGRLAHVFLSDKRCRYKIFDIEPARTISELYLKSLHPLQETESVLPDCIENEPANAFDVFVSISTFPEMRPEQTENYLKEIARTTKRLVYFKQWRTWRNVADGFTFDYRSLKMPKEWRLIMDRKDRFNPAFQEMAWSRE